MSDVVILGGARTPIGAFLGGLAPLTGQSIAILTLLLMVVVSYVILQRVTDERRDWVRLAMGQ